MITVLAAWMLDPVVCARMEIGAPRVSVTALIEMHRLLIERGFRRSSRTIQKIVQEEQNKEFAKIGSDSGGAAHCSAAPAQHSVRFHLASGNEPVKALESGTLGQPLDASGGRRGGGAQQ